MKLGFTGIVGLALSIPTASAAVIIIPRKRDLRRDWLGHWPSAPGDTRRERRQSRHRGARSRFFGFRASPYAAQLL
jgi:hypothetical protein